MPTATAEPKPAAGAVTAGNGEKPPLLYEDPDTIVRSPFNRQIDTKSPAFAELTASIKQKGLIEPLIVRPLLEGMVPGLPGRPGFKYELIAGERRWRAAKAS